MKVCGQRPRSVLRNRIKAFSYAFAGLRVAVSQEVPVATHLVAFCGLLITGFLVHLDATEWVMVICCSCFVLAAELFNSTVERLCDLVQPSFNPAVKVIKDISAAAVLMAVLAACAVATYITVLHCTK